MSLNMGWQLVAVGAVGSNSPYMHTDWLVSLIITSELNMYDLQILLMLKNLVNDAE